MVQVRHFGLWGRSLTRRREDRLILWRVGCERGGGVDKGGGGGLGGGGVRPPGGGKVGFFWGGLHAGGVEFKRGVGCLWGGGGVLWVRALLCAPRLLRFSEKVFPAVDHSHAYHCCATSSCYGGRL